MTNDGNSCMDSALDSMMDSSKLSKPLLKRSLKASNLIDESNMSFDEDSMMGAQTPLAKCKMSAETDGEEGEVAARSRKNEDDDCSVDENSNLPGMGLSGLEFLMLFLFPSHFMTCKKGIFDDWIQKY